MSVELISVLIAVLAIGATVAGVILTGSRGLRLDMARRDRRGSRRSCSTARAHGAPGRVAGRLARGHQRTGGGQLRDEKSRARKTVSLRDVSPPASPGKSAKKGNPYDLPRYGTQG